MQVFLIGDWKWDNYEPAFARALERQGHQVVKGEGSSAFASFLGRVESALTVLGPYTLWLNIRLLRQFETLRPDVVILWRATQIHPFVVARMAKKSRVTTYTFDYPFGSLLRGLTPWHHRFLWRWYLKYLKYAQLNVFNRAQNLIDAPRFGSRINARMLPYFVPERDKPAQLQAEEMSRFGCEVTFVGHFESDGRDEHLIALVLAGVNVRLWGTGWQLSKNKQIHSVFGDVEAVHGDDYALAISGSQIALCFLSRLNQDTYTQRCFEIPAIGSLLLAERTQDLQDMFLEDEEACFFSSPSELVEKVMWLLENPEIRTKIAKQGQERVWRDRHHIDGRAEDFMTLVRELDAPDALKRSRD